MTTTSSPDLCTYEDLGAGAPVVLLHPSGLGPAVVQPFARRLATGHRVVIPHRSGFGGAVDRPPPASLDAVHDDLAALLDALGLDRPVLVGVSAGATLALGFSRRYPGRATVLAHEPLIGPLGGELHHVVGRRIRRLLARSHHPCETSLFITDLVGVPAWNRLRADWRDDVERCAAATRAEAALFADFALTDTDLQAWSERGDVLVTVGAHSPPARHELVMVLTRRAVPTACVPRAGHLPVIEAPAAFADLVTHLVDHRARS